MGGFANYWEKVIMNTFFNISGTLYTASRVTTNLWVGLSSADPLDDASGVSEPPGKGYLRIKTTNASATTWQVADATGTTIDNASAIEFAAASADWGTMTHFCLFSGGTAGASLCAYGALSASKTIENGDIARFAIGQLDICLK